MSEPKRATLSTISTQKSEVKNVKEKSKTVRFFLTLPESNEESCPEYNYRDLLNSAEKKNKLKEKAQPHQNGLNNLDPFGDDNDDDVKRIAQQFEAKYGLPNKKRRNKKDDYADIGAGYDESDSFIDNTDAYDEMVPADVTTLHGGFYINSGALEFKQVDLSGSESSDSEESDKEVKNTTANRKRIIEDTDESDSEDEKDRDEVKTEHVEKKQKLDTNGLQKPVKKKILPSDDKDLAPKKKKIEENPQKKKCVTVKDLLREKREEFDMTIESVVDNSEKAENKPSGSSTINDVIESVINAGRVVNIDENSKDSSSSDDVAVVSAASTDSEASRDGLPRSAAQTPTLDQAAKPEPEQPIVKLPENLPNNLLDIIIKIKKAAENSEGKVKFFSGPVNNMLLNVEVQCRKLGKSSRLQVYEHLAPFVKCKKDTLMRRAKNLLLDQERSKVKDPLTRLKVAIENTMPVVIKSYEKECQKVRDEMFLANANANSENGEVNNKVRKLPRKKFPWSEETRKIFQEIILLTRKCYTLEGIRKETFTEHIETFFKTTVLCLWPEGWMSVASLMKQAKPIIALTQKPKLPIQTASMSPISLDIVTSATNTPLLPSPTKNLSLSPCASSGITVIPIPPINSTSIPPMNSNSCSLLNTNGPKIKHSNPSSAKISDLSVPVNKKSDTPVNSTSILNMSAEICAVTNSKEINSVPTSLLMPSKSSVTITSVDLRTNNSSKKDKEDDVMALTVSENHEQHEHREQREREHREQRERDIREQREREHREQREREHREQREREHREQREREHREQREREKREQREREKRELREREQRENREHREQPREHREQSREHHEQRELPREHREQPREHREQPREHREQPREHREHSREHHEQREQPREHHEQRESREHRDREQREHREQRDREQHESHEQHDIHEHREHSEFLITKTPTPTTTVPKPTNLKQRILSEMAEKSNSENDDECQIIDLTESPAVVRKPGPKSKTRFIEAHAKPKPVKQFKQLSEETVLIKPEEITGTQALNQIITGLTKYGSNSTENNAKTYKENQSGVNEDDMEQVMKDLKELQKLHEHARKNDIDIMAPSSSPVSVIAFNSSYSPNKTPANDLSTQKEKERKTSAENTAGFQDIFQKHLFQEVPVTKSQPTGVYNSNIQPKSNFNSVSNFSYSTTGSISNSLNNIRYTQSSSKYNAPMNHLPANPPGATNHNDDFTLFQNFLYQYGFHNTSGPKQKSPP